MSLRCQPGRRGTGQGLHFMAAHTLLQRAIFEPVLMLCTAESCLVKPAVQPVKFHAHAVHLLHMTCKGHC